MQSEPVIRLGFSLGVFGIMALWENLAPRRHRSRSRQERWPANLGVSLLDGLVARIVAPGGAVGFALLAESRGWGLFNFVAWPGWAEAPLALLLLDLAIYVQHRVFHAVPALWRLHRTHHTDLDLDVSSGGRFHPLEISLSLGFKLLVILALGASPLVVLVFEVTLNASALFNHSNVRLPAGVERILRWLVVTPDLHRVHHSILRRETNSNFGFNFPWWDRLFGTYCPEPNLGHENMTVGLEEFRAPAELRLDSVLTQPFRKDKSSPANELVAQCGKNRG